MKMRHEQLAGSAGGLILRRHKRGSSAWLTIMRIDPAGRRHLGSFCSALFEHESRQIKLIGNLYDLCNSLLLRWEQTGLTLHGPVHSRRSYCRTRHPDIPPQHACSIYVNITINRSVLISPPTNFLSPSYASGTGSQNTLSAVVTQQQSLSGEIFSLTNSTFNQVERSEPKTAIRSFSTYSQ